MMEKLLNPQEMADILGVKVSTIYQWTHQEFIPHVKLGHFVRFKYHDVMKWVDKKSLPGRVRRRVDVDIS